MKPPTFRLADVFVVLLIAHSAHAASNEFGHWAVWGTAIILGTIYGVVRP